MNRHLDLDRVEHDGTSERAGSGAEDVLACLTQRAGDEDLEIRLVWVHEPGRTPYLRCWKWRRLDARGEDFHPGVGGGFRIYPKQLPTVADAVERALGLAAEWARLR